MHRLVLAVAALGALAFLSPRPLPDWEKQPMSTMLV